MIYRGLNEAFHVLDIIPKPFRKVEKRTKLGGLVVVADLNSMLGAGAPLLPRRMNSTDLKLSKVEHDPYFVHLTYTLGERK